eukprot:CAMPEP_0172174026 /NCGR_PEP_ID=MMETSP1050-20130122/13421_1 /TAXON_ID=233186 /ORGANISM="Cryptomonas curvata, Strain CCAP979/52" /LENGTH=58 /DNA_ID=CAMNT_0012845927 /DNA_START=298 /DNA_END=474 /DNA_ORIENTATION=-
MAQGNVTSGTPAQGPERVDRAHVRDALAGLARAHMHARTHTRTVTQAHIRTRAADSGH